MVKSKQRQIHWEAIGKIMSFIFSIVAMCVFMSLHLYARKNIKTVIKNTPTSFLFYYKPSSKILMKDYKSNRMAYNKLNDVVRYHKKELISGKSHLNIITYIYPSDMNKLKAINEHSIQANILRSLIKVRYLINYLHFTFYFDASYTMKNRVCVRYIPDSIREGSNQDIFYTLHSDSICLVNTINKYINKYGKIPLINGKGADFIKTNKKGKRPVVNSLSAKTDGRKLKLEKDISLITINVNDQKNETKGICVFLPIMNIKTNFLYWEGITSEFIRRDIIPNMELELYLRNQISISTDYTYIYLNKEDKNISATKQWGISAVGIEPRYWLGHSEVYRGFYMGIYGLYGQYDVKSNSAESYGHTGSLYEGGLSFGYAYLFSPHWGFEIGARAGYRSTKGDVYQFVKPHYYRTDTYSENKVKLTKIIFSLIYRVGKSVRYKK